MEDVEPFASGRPFSMTSKVSEKAVDGCGVARVVYLCLDTGIDDERGYRG